MAMSVASVVGRANEICGCGCVGDRVCGPGVGACLCGAGACRRNSGGSGFDAGIDVDVGVPRRRHGSRHRVATNERLLSHITWRHFHRRRRGNGDAGGRDLSCREKRRRRRGQKEEEEDEKEEEEEEEDDVDAEEQDEEDEEKE